MAGGIRGKGESVDPCPAPEQPYSRAGVGKRARLRYSPTHTPPNAYIVQTNGEQQYYKRATPGGRKCTGWGHSSFAGEWPHLQSIRHRDGRLGMAHKSGFDLTALRL